MFCIWGPLFDLQTVREQMPTADAHTGWPTETWVRKHRVGGLQMEECQNAEGAKNVVGGPTPPLPDTLQMRSG